MPSSIGKRGRRDEDRGHGGACVNTLVLVSVVVVAVVVDSILVYTFKSSRVHSQPDYSRVNHFIAADNGITMV